jgi:nuclear protein localization family protein 4
MPNSLGNAASMLTQPSLWIRHGDLLFVAYKENAAAEASTSQTNGIHPNKQAEPTASADLSVKAGKKPWELVTEDPVDTFWEAQDGKIKRSRDSRMCRHGDKSMCDHCMPLEVSRIV